MLGPLFRIPPHLAPKLSVGTYLLALVLAIALPMLAFIAIILWQLQTSEDAALLRRTERTAETVARAAANQLRDMAVTVRLLTSAPELEEQDLGQFHARTQATLRQNNWFLIVVDKNGQQLLNTRVPYGTPLGLTSNVPSLNEALKSKRKVVSNAFFGRTAGRWGLSMLSPAATSTGGFNALAHHWSLVEETAREHGTCVSRANWRVAGPVHIAESREQARKDTKFGLGRWLHYFQKVVALPGVPDHGDPDYCLDAMVDAGFVVCGDPDDLVTQIARLEEQTGGFGAFLVTAHDWADREATHRSYDLIARFVMPKFQDASAWTERSMGWVSENRTPFLAAATQGMLEAIQKDREQRDAAPR